MREFTNKEKELMVNTPITKRKFDMSKFNNVICELNCDYDVTALSYWECIIDGCEKMRQLYIETKDDRYFTELVRLLPNSYKVVKL